MRALITGIAGFAGSHLTEHLLALGNIEIHGVYLPQFGTANLRQVAGSIALHAGDVSDYPTVLRIMEDVRPDLVFHLAAQAAPSLSLTKPGETLITNILGQLHILQAAVQAGLSPRILVVGSADEYGQILPGELPVRETNGFRPVNPYSVSKIAQDYLGYQYFLSHHLPVVRVRPFNHIGPRQGPGFVVADFARQVAEAEAGIAAPVVRVGNLDSRRDFTDVRDMTRAYYLALTLAEPGEVYNLGTGKSWAIGDVLKGLVAQSAIPLTVVADPSRLRPTDILDVVCDCTKFHARTGWRPEIPMERTLRDVLDYWRGQVALAGRPA